MSAYRIKSERRKVEFTSHCPFCGADAELVVRFTDTGKPEYLPVSPCVCGEKLSA